MTFVQTPSSKEGHVVRSKAPELLLVLRFTAVSKAKNNLSITLILHVAVIIKTRQRDNTFIKYLK